MKNLFICYKNELNHAQEANSASVKLSRCLGMDSDYPQTMQIRTYQFTL